MAPPLVSPKKEPELLGMGSSRESHLNEQILRIGSEG